MANIKTISDIFFTSDCHYYHGKILWLGRGRPFGSPQIKTVAEALYAAMGEGRTAEVDALAQRLKELEAEGIEEMNETMVAHHNEVVRKGSRVYNLGDFALKCTLEQAMTVRKRLNGQHFLVPGNHDSIAKEMGKQAAWVWMKQIERIDVNVPEKRKIALCHYAMRTWHGSNKGVWQLYGHFHGLLPELDSTLAFDVGVDCWNYYPVSMEQVIEKMRAKTPAWEAFRRTFKAGEMEF